MYGSAADDKLDAMYEARERDPVPDETPPTDEEMQVMAEFFNQPRIDIISWEHKFTLPFRRSPNAAPDWIEVVVELPDEARKRFIYFPDSQRIVNGDNDTVRVALYQYPRELADNVTATILERAKRPTPQETVDDEC